MNVWKKEMVERATIFFHEYGKVSLIGVSLLINAVALVVLFPLVQPGRLKVSFLDVGQGDAILVQTPSGHDMLIDGGPSDVVMARLSAEMKYFDRDLDIMISTHEDADHATGLIPVMKTMDVGTIVMSPVRSETAVAADLFRYMNIETTNIRTGGRNDVIDFRDGVVAHILYPPKTDSSKLDTNDASVSIVILYGDHSFLLTGDLSSKYENRLIGTVLPKAVTVYKAGHHGSKTSSGEELLSYTKPEYSIISAGKENRYGHPNEEAMVRLRKYSKEIISTIDKGTITFTSDGRTLEVDAKK